MRLNCIIFTHETEISTYPSAMQEAFVQIYHKVVLQLPDGKHLSFHKGLFHQKTTACNLSLIYRACEIGSNAQRIISIVIVGTAVVVDIAEIVSVVVVRGTQPPITRGTLPTPHHTTGFTEVHPYIGIVIIYLYRFLILL